MMRQLESQDSLLTQAGELSLTRDNNTGQVTSSALGAVTTAAAYNLFAEPAATTTRYNQTDLLKESMTRDHLGRITSKSQTTAAGTNVLTYAYDPACRLVKVEQNGAPKSTYQYDVNGNRVSSTTPGSSFPITATYDNQDRQLTNGRNAYTYTTNGDLKTKTNQSKNDQTTYGYDAFSNLKAVELPGSQTVTYTTDASDHRTARKVNGVTTNRYVYSGDSLIAELSPDATPTKLYIYATQGHVPDYMVKLDTGVKYRFVKDHLGSPRLIVNTSTGNIAQAINYAEFGQVTADSNPGFQPFGFAGGIYDEDTKLTRFGARDYDAETGRWTAKDPIGFAGGDTNLYGYVMSDPVNFVDPSGLILSGPDWRLPNPLAPVVDWTKLKGEDAAAFYADITSDPNAGWLAKGGAWAGGLLTSLWTCETADDTANTLVGVGGIGPTVVRKANNNPYLRIGMGRKGGRPVYRISIGNKNLPVHKHIDLWPPREIFKSVK